MTTTSLIDALVGNWLRSISYSVLSVTAVSAFATDYPSQPINRVDVVHFGQFQTEVEKMVETAAVEFPPRIRFAGDHKEIDLGAVKLEFDTGRLVRISFERDFDYDLGISAYPESWRNFSNVGQLGVRRGMTKLQFQEYLRSWEERAKSLGARRIVRKHGYLLSTGEYSMSKTVNESIDLLHIEFGPERSTGRGGVWGDGCSVDFATQESIQWGQTPGTLISISVFRDEFDTWARNTQVANQLPDPTSPSVTSPAGAGAAPAVAAVH